MKFVMNHPTHFLYQTASRKTILVYFSVEKWLWDCAQYPACRNHQNTSVSNLAVVALGW